MQTATATKTAIELAKEKLAQAKAEYDAAEEVLNGPARRLAKARQELYNAQAAVADLTETRYEGGKKV